MSGLWQNANFLLTHYQYLLLACWGPTIQHHKGSKLQVNFTHSPCVSATSVCQSLTGSVLP